MDSMNFTSENINPAGFNYFIDSKETVLPCNMMFILQFSLSLGTTCHRVRGKNQLLAMGSSFLTLEITV